MKKSILIAVLTASIATSAFAQWKPAGDKIKTKWAEQVNPENVLPEYPRPVMERGEWKNLNGLWNYAITEKGAAPSAYEGQILVPFAIESSLSGVGKKVGPDKELWYQRTFTVPASWKGKKVMLNFGAVDWKADIWVNDIKVGQHTGGFTPFSLDITAALATKGDNKRMGPDRSRTSASWQTGKPSGRHLVYGCYRYLANCLDGACGRTSYN